MNYITKLKYAVLIFLMISAQALALQDFEVIYDEKTKTKKLVSTSGNTPQLRDKLSKHYQTEGLLNHQEMDLDDALINYEISVRYKPNAEVLADMAECYFYMNEPDSAFACIERAKKVDTLEKRIYQVLVDYHAKNNDKIKAIEYATYLTNIDTALNTRLRLAYLYQDINIFKSAEIVEGCIKRDSTNSELYLYLMDIYRYVRDEEKYIKNEEKYMSSPNKQTKTVRSITDAYLEEKSIKSVLKYIDTLKAYNTKERFEEIVRFVYPFTIYHDLMTSDDVEKFFKFSEELSDKDLSKAIKSNLYLLKNEINKAWELEKDIVGKKSVYTLFSVLANMTANKPLHTIKLIKNNVDSLIFFSPEQYNAVESLLLGFYEYETLLKMQINNYKRNLQDSTMPIRIGDLAAVLGDNKTAAEYYEKALPYYENDASILNNYAYFVAISGGDLNIAEKYADKSLKINPENMNAIDTYGWIMHLKGNSKKAEEYLRKAMKLEEHAPEVYYHLAMVYLKQKKYGLYALNYLKSIEKRKVASKAEKEE